MRTGYVTCSLLVLGLASVIGGCWSGGPTAEELEGLTPGPTPNRAILVALSTTVEGIPSDGREVRMWVPLPGSDEHQVLTERQIQASLRPMVRYGPVHGNPMVYFSGDEPLPERLSAVVSFKLAMHRCNGPEPGKATALTAKQLELLSAYLESSGKEDALKQKVIELDERLEAQEGDATALSGERAGLMAELARIADRRELVQEVVRKLGDEELSSLQKVRKVYDHLLEKLSPVEEVAEKRTLVAAYRSGQVSASEYIEVMVTVLRGLGVPARTEHGILLPEDLGDVETEVTGSHRWVGVYIGSVGWVPVDPLAAEAKPELIDYYFGTNCAGRVRVGWGSQVNLTPVQLGGPVELFSEPRVEVDETVVPVMYRITVRDLASGSGRRGGR